MDAPVRSPGARINVLFLMIHMIGMGGSERLILNLLRKLDRRIFAPSVGSFIEGPPLKEFAELGIPMHLIPKVKRFDWNAIRQVGRIIREHRIDIVNAHHFMPFVYAYYGTRIANRAALVYTEHSESDVLSATGRWRIAGSCLLRSCQAIGVTERVSRTLTSHFRLHPEKVHTIRNGVDVELLGLAVEKRERARQRYGFGPKDILIGQVANFRRNKNHLFLLNAFREVARQRSDTKLVFVGEGTADPDNSEPAVMAYIRDHGLSDRVHLLGYQPDVTDLLGMMDVFCLVSYREGLPLSLLEAMAAGLPAVGTNIEGIRGVIQPEVNGLMVAPDDVPDLALALRRLVTDADLRRRMGAASRQIANEKYTLQRCVAETKQLFLSLSSCRSAQLR